MGAPIPRQFIISGAKNCLKERKTCPRSCPLMRYSGCQKIILREAIKMYDELCGREPDDSFEQACLEDETQEGT